MYRLVIICLFSFLQVYCVQPEARNVAEKTPEKPLVAVQDTTPKWTRLKHLGMAERQSSHTYQATKSNILAHLKRVQASDVSDDSVSNLFTDRLLTEIIPYWYGTPWSFTGHTEVPKKGEIACGYFVSTTLRDMGVNINRYKLAQQLPINEAKSLLCGSELLTISGNTSQEIITKMKEKLTEGIHFIGFANSHVGYVVKRGDELLLIHSVFLQSKGVDVEFAAESEVFGMFSTFYISPISQNTGLMKAWKTGKVVKVVVE